MQLNKYNNQLIQQVNRMDRTRLPPAVVKFQPTGKTNTGKSLNGLLYCEGRERPGLADRVKFLQSITMMMTIMIPGIKALVSRCRQAVASNQPV